VGVNVPVRECGSESGGGRRRGERVRTREGEKKREKEKGKNEDAKRDEKSSYPRENRKTRPVSKIRAD